MLTSIKAYVASFGAILLAGLAIFGATMKAQRDNQKRRADTLHAQAHANKIKRQIKREEEVKLVSRRAEIKEEIEKKKEGGDFEGIDNLTNSNDF